MPLDGQFAFQEPGISNVYLWQCNPTADPCRLCLPNLRSLAACGLANMDGSGCHETLGDIRANLAYYISEADWVDLNFFFPEILSEPCYVARETASRKLGPFY